MESQQNTTLSYIHKLLLNTIVLLPSIYMLFGLFADDRWVVLWGLLWGLPYLAIGGLILFGGLSFHVSIIVGLYLLHGFYGLYHDLLFINSGVFAWYPCLCAIYDFGVCLLILLSYRLLQRAIDLYASSSPLFAKAR